MEQSIEVEPPALRRHRANGYGLLRLALASLVIVHHTLYLTGHEEYTFVGFTELGRRANLGYLAVAGFFALSGFLLQASVIRNAPGRFFRLRFFRLMPGFWTTLLVVAFLLTPLIAWLSGTGGSYRILGADSAITYALSNAGLLILQPSIGGVLSTHPYPRALDGSLWTVLPEFTCYMTLLAVTWFGRRVGFDGWWPPALVAGGGVLVFWLAEPMLPGGTGLVVSEMASLAASFFLGSTIAALHLQRWATRKRPQGWRCSWHWSWGLVCGCPSAHQPWPPSSCSSGRCSTKAGPPGSVRAEICPMACTCTTSRSSS